MSGMVNAAVSTGRQPLPVYPDEQACSEPAGMSQSAIAGSSRVSGVYGRGSAKVDTGIAPLLRELERADAVRVGQRCSTLDPVGDLTAVVAQPAGEFCE
jgi:hypothetical protein